MATPKVEILNVFHTKFQSITPLPHGLEDQFLLNAIGDFELDLYKIQYNKNLEEFEENLSQPEINLLGLLMYRSYLGRERDRILKLNNIVGKDIKLTSMSDSKRTMSDAMDKLNDDIKIAINKLKDNSFYD
ncbi:hypothetical protein [Halalkalibacter oceani]|uniref:hypothetical protein n=1 Tax=Halalkalibacter oceani TaxID=1653776 RepID=UPI00339904C6